jgi:hypothetical protein
MYQSSCSNGAHRPIRGLTFGLLLFDDWNESSVCFRALKRVTATVCPEPIAYHRPRQAWNDLEPDSQML